MYSFVDQSNCTFMVHVVVAVYMCACFVEKFTYFVVKSNFPHFVYCPTFSGVVTTKRFLCVTRLV